MEVDQRSTEIMHRMIDMIGEYLKEGDEDIVGQIGAALSGVSTYTAVMLIDDPEDQKTFLTAINVQAFIKLPRYQKLKRKNEQL